MPAHRKINYNRENK